MKLTSLKYVLALAALFSVTILGGAAAFDVLGAHAPALMTAEVALGLFVTAFFLQLLVADYSGARRVRMRRPVRPVLLPATAAFGRAVSVSGTPRMSRSMRRPSLTRR